MVALDRQASRMTALHLQTQDQPTTHPRMQFCARQVATHAGTCSPSRNRGGRLTLGFTYRDTDVVPGLLEAASVAFHIGLQSLSSCQHAHQPSQIDPGRLQRSPLLCTELQSAGCEDPVPTHVGSGLPSALEN